MKSETDVHRSLRLYADTVQRICFMHLKNRSDAEDVFQEVFLKHFLREAPFESDAHEKAWLIRVAVNSCKDVLKSFWRKRVSSLDDVRAAELALPEPHRDVLDAVLRLKPPKYRDVVYLYYYEGYRAAEIASILGQKESTVYTWLNRARAQLKIQLGGEPGA